MTDGQMRVLMILLATFGVEILFSPISKNLINGVTGHPIDATVAIASQIPASVIGTLTFSLGVLLLVLLAQPAPGVATMLAVIILASVTLRHSQDIQTFIGTAAVGLNLLRNGG